MSTEDFDAEAKRCGYERARRAMDDNETIAQGRYNNGFFGGGNNKRETLA